MTANLGATTRGVLFGAVLAAGILPATTAPAAQFEIITLPDTEYYVETYPTIPPAQTQWIVDHKAQENIAFVSHMGDTVHHPLVDPAQWNTVTGAMYKLDPVVPYGVSPGNHDLEDPTGFIARFGPAHLASQSWYGGASSNKLNSCQIFSAGGYQFLHISLQTGPDAATRAWAVQQILANPGKPTIISTHDYLDTTGARDTAGNTIWNDIVNNNPQVFMVLSGHNRGVSRLVSTNASNKPVLQMMANYQDYTTSGTSKDTGYLRKIIFDTTSGTICVESYSPTFAAQPWLNQSTEQFAFKASFLPQTTSSASGPVFINDTTLLPIWTGAGTQPAKWSNAANWSATVPNAAEAVALFCASSVRNITVDVPVTLATIEFIADQSYTLSGISPITLSGTRGASLSVFAGTPAGHTIGTPVLAQSNLNIDVASATVLNMPRGLTIAPDATATKTSGGALHLGPVSMQAPSSVLNLSAGQITLGHLYSGQLHIGPDAAVRLDSDPVLTVIDGLEVEGSGKLDLSDNTLVVRYTGTSPSSSLRQLIRQGAIFTSVVPLAGTAAVALVDNSLLHLTEWHGQTISDGSDFSQLLLICARTGDVNLDGEVTQADYSNLIANLGGTQKAWFQGDLDGDGNVTLADLSLVTQNLIAGAGGTPFAVSGPDSATVVPEPVCWTLLAVGATALRRRTRRNRTASR